MQAQATRIADVLAEAQETRRQWDALTEPTRRAALAADAELRRRHPDQVLEPLKSAEPDGGTVPDPAHPPRNDVWIQQALDGSAHLPGPEAELSADEEPPRSGIPGQEVLSPAPEAAGEDIPERIERIRENARMAQMKIDELRDARVPSEDAEESDLGRAWTVLARRGRDAIIQPARPDIVPASEILRQAEARQAAAGTHDHEHA
ncbi:MAG TPA: hypothetical protein VMV92_21910 [Streptosporangiaceae bacterium]|nr:hypothetical protein [Streptosporangiaceae bacterium]